ncbi:unnamed protein product, partial [Rotaria sp. Silwood1]
GKAYSDIVEEAAQGIVAEGTSLDKLKEAEWLANELLGVKRFGIDIEAEFLGYNIPVEIGQTCVYLFTKDSFLYRRINSILRSVDTVTLAQVKTLGPYCWLLYWYLTAHPTLDMGTVYRGVNLSDEQRQTFMKETDWSNLDEFTVPNSCITLAEFVSTSKNRQLAEIYGNTLFVIGLSAYDETPMPTVLGDGIVSYSVYEMQPVPTRYGTYIESMSNFPEEEEFLIPPGIKFRFEKYEYDAANDKHVIYIDCSK